MKRAMSHYYQGCCKMNIVTMFPNFIRKNQLPVAKSLWSLPKPWPTVIHASQFYCQKIMMNSSCDKFAGRNAVHISTMTTKCEQQVIFNMSCVVQVKIKQSNICAKLMRHSHVNAYVHSMRQK